MSLKTSNADPNTLQQMDDAAVEAEKDLSVVGEEATKALAEWWQRWYLQAGHKRLARVLLRQLKT